MMQKPWFKAFVWFMSIFMFFLSATVLISIFKPGPSESEVMRFMEAMMHAMESSVMGAAMGIEHNAVLQKALSFSAYVALPVIVIGVIGGLAVRYLHRGDPQCSTKRK